MNLLDSLNKLVAFLENCQYTNLLLAAEQESSDSPLIQQLNLHQNVAEEFKENLIKLLKKSLLDIRLSEYIPGYKPDGHEFCYIKLVNNPKISRLIEEISQIEQAEIFSEQDKVIDNLKFYTIICSDNNGKKSVFFRTYSPKKELNRRGGFVLMMNKGQYNTIKNKVFLFDENIDCFTWNGILFIKNIYYFQKIFKYFEQIRSKATETLNLVTAKIPIQNIDEFKNACTGQLAMMEKLAIISKKPYLQQIKMEDIKRTINQFQLDIPVVDENGEEKLVFQKDSSKRWLILKLLDDDYLGSIMTREKYEVNSKRSVSGS